MKASKIKKYSKKERYSYSLGSFPTFELLENKPEAVDRILVHSDAREEIREKLAQKCEKANVEILESDRCVEKLRDKDNCVIMGVFRKYKCKLDFHKNHVVLVNPSDMGNLGTIIRSCVGFGITNLALIEPAVDIFHPKVVRASMGAIFQMNFEYFPCFSQYTREYGSEREKYSFMLNGEYRLGTFEHSASKPYSLIFGNEASGLDESFLHIGKSVVIPHTRSVDSLNLALAIGIGVYEFCK
ncbi:MAG: TrmH family RNA methyltransferase [bacterium]|nr:TrmH family RNA methyltransferase [bacterium]MCM1373481.1 TrmH family RNA methyltransferase [Muribaculum sp.]